MENPNQNRTEHNRDYVSKVFMGREEADHAYSDLLQRGYTQDEINVLMSDETRNTHFGEDQPKSGLEDSVADSAGKGSMIGGGIGAAVGAIAAIGTNVLLPGLGLVVAGPIAAGLAGAGAGAATGGIVGALTGMGEPETEAERYQNEIKEGGIYMGVKPRDEDDGRNLYENWYENY